MLYRVYNLRKTQAELKHLVNTKENEKVKICPFFRFSCPHHAFLVCLVNIAAAIFVANATINRYAPEAKPHVM